MQIVLTFAKHWIITQESGSIKQQALAINNFCDCILVSDRIDHLSFGKYSSTVLSQIVFFLAGLPVLTMHQSVVTCTKLDAAKLH